VPTKKVVVVCLSWDSRKEVGGTDSSDTIDETKRSLALNADRGKRLGPGASDMRPRGTVRGCERGSCDVWIRAKDEKKREGGRRRRTEEIGRSVLGGQRRGPEDMGSEARKGGTSADRPDPRRVAVEEFSYGSFPRDDHRPSARSWLATMSRAQSRLR
jgi:hypothetical protein